MSLIKQHNIRKYMQLFKSISYIVFCKYVFYPIIWGNLVAYISKKSIYFLWFSKWSCKWRLYLTLRCLCVSKDACMMNASFECFFIDPLKACMSLTIITVGLHPQTKGEHLRTSTLGSASLTCNLHCIPESSSETTIIWEQMEWIYDSYGDTAVWMLTSWQTRKQILK